MIQPLVRLKKHKDFVNVAEQGRKYVTKGLILQVLVRPEENQYKSSIRVGFTTSRKIGNAVKRNRIRRRLKEIVRLYLPEIAPNGCDYVVIGRTRTLTRPHKDLVQDLKDAVVSI